MGVILYRKHGIISYRDYIIYGTGDYNIQGSYRDSVPVFPKSLQ